MALLEAVAETGAITSAARSLGMSYRRAWLLIEATNALFRRPVVETTPGGQRGGGAELTSFGLEVVARYRRIEQASLRAARRDTRFLERNLADG